MGTLGMFELVHKMLRGRAGCGIDAEYVLKRRRDGRGFGIDHAAYRVDDRGEGNAAREEGRDGDLVRGVELRGARAAFRNRGAAERGRGEAHLVRGFEIEPGDRREVERRAWRRHPL